MNQTIKTIFALFVLVFLVSCATQVQESVKQSAPATNSQKPITSLESGSVLVEIKDFSFAPAELHVKAGAVVEWINLDNVPHTATSTSGPESFDSKTLSKNEKYAFTFTKQGTYEYYCEFHPGMRAKIVVE